jgi:hypothetical protein
MLFPVGVSPSGTKDPVSRITLLPERISEPQPRKQRWWSRRQDEDDGIFRPGISWRALPGWFTTDGVLRNPDR